jgi:hypothetical protein
MPCFFGLGLRLLRDKKDGCWTFGACDTEAPLATTPAAEGGKGSTDRACDALLSKKFFAAWTDTTFGGCLDGCAFESESGAVIVASDSAGVDRVFKLKLPDVRGRPSPFAPA